MKRVRILKETDGNDESKFIVQFRPFSVNTFFGKISNLICGWKDFKSYFFETDAEDCMRMLGERYEFDERSKKIKREVWKK